MSTLVAPARRRRRGLALAALLPTLALAGCGGPAEVEWDAGRAEAAVRAQSVEDAQVLALSGDELRERLENASEGTDLLGPIAQDASQECRGARSAYGDAVRDGAAGYVTALPPSEQGLGLDEYENVHVLVFEDTAAREAAEKANEKARQECELLDDDDDAETATVQVEGREATARRAEVTLFGGSTAVSTLNGSSANVLYTFQRAGSADAAPSAQDYADDRAEDAEQLLKDLRG